MLHHNLKLTTDKCSLEYAQTAAHMLQEIANVMDVSYVKAVAGISLLILDTVQTVKNNKEQCMQMVTQIHKLVCAIISLSRLSEAQLSLPVLQNIALLSKTLEKIHTCVRSLLDTGLLKRIIHHRENTSLLEECMSELNHAVQVFGAQTDILAVRTMTSLQQDAIRRHQEMLELFDAPENADALSFQTMVSSRGSSQSSLSLLPANPKIFHGREKELTDIIHQLLKDKATRIAILGAGGIGKSSLALAALYHETIIAKFVSHRFFIPCDGANSSAELLSQVALYFGLTAHGQHLKAIIQCLSSISEPALLILDNLETAWEPAASRKQVENFLSLLAEISHLHLIITMRGAERPAQVQWTHPFLPPLRPLSFAAARQTFIEIADDVGNEEEIEQLLALTDYLPLAISLIANVVAYEGCQPVLERWQTETTSVLSLGADRTSSLEKSIIISLSSPRMTFEPYALQLLRLLSILPDGLSHADIKEIQAPLDISKNKVTLLRTSLAYISHDGKLKVLVPIREYVRAKMPPDESLVAPIYDYFSALVDFFKQFDGNSFQVVMKTLSGNLSNISSVLQLALQVTQTDLRKTVQCVCKFVQILGRIGQIDFGNLLHLVYPYIASIDDPDLHGEYLYILAFSHTSQDTRKSYLLDAMAMFKASNNLRGQGMIFDQLAQFDRLAGNMQNALNHCHISITLAKQSGDLSMQSGALHTLSQIQDDQGHYHLAVLISQQSQLLAKSAGDLYREARALAQQGRIFVGLGNFRKASTLLLEGDTISFAIGIESNSILRQTIANLRAEVYLRKTEYDDALKLNQAILNIPRKLDILNDAWPFSLLNIALINCLTNNYSYDTTLQDIDTASQTFFKQLCNRGLASCDYTRAILYLKMGQIDHAKGFFLQGLSTAQGKFADIEIICLAGLSDVSNHEKNMYQLLCNTVCYFSYACKTKNLEATYQALRHLGDICIHQSDKDSDTALSLFQMSLEGFTFMDIHQARGDCMVRIGDIFNDEGKVEEAREMWRGARPLFVRSSQMHDVFQCDKRLNVKKKC